MTIPHGPGCRTTLRCARTYYRSPISASNQRMTARDSLSPEGKGAIPFGMWSKARPFLPVLAGNTIQIPDHKPVSHREFAGQLLMTFEPASQAIHEAEVTLFQSQDGYVSRGSCREMAELFVPDFFRRIPGGAQNDIIHQHSQVQEF